MNKIKGIFEKQIKYAWMITTAVISLIMMVFLCTKNVTQMIYDCEYYWTIGDPVFENGIHLLNFPETFRGYVWPMVVQVIRRMGGFAFFRIAMSICVAVFFAIVLPYIFDKTVTKIADVARLIVLTVVTLYMWGDFFAYPLSDFAAVFFITVGIACIKYDMNSTGFLRSMILGGVSGLMLYAAYNTRASYLYSFLFLFIYIVCEYKKRHRLKPVFIAGMVIGCIVLALPQSLINHHYTGSYSPRVFTEQYTNYQVSLQKKQVLLGLMYSNYESYAGPPDEYPDARVYFEDDAGCEIITREQITEENFTYQKLFKLFLKYPLDMISIYTRHFVSLMTPKFPEMYISDMYPDKGLMTFMTIIIWFVTILNLLYGMKSNINWSKVMPMIAVFVPALLQLLGEPEIRFFVAIHLIGYFYSIYYVDYSVYRGMVRKMIIPVIVCFLLFAFLWTSILSSVLGNNKERTLLINDRNMYSTGNYDPTGLNEVLP